MSTMIENTQFSPSFLYNDSSLKNYDFELDSDSIAYSLVSEYNTIKLQYNLLDALSASVWQTYLNTSEYRWRGEDTLTWGNPVAWLKVEWFRKNFRKSIIEHSLEQYNILEEIIYITNSNKLEEFYKFRNKDKIINYLRSYPDLTNFLEESYYHLLKNFGNVAKYALEIINDPEAKQEYLIVYINTSMTIDDALERLDRFDNEWFLAQINLFGHLVNFNLEIK